MPNPVPIGADFKDSLSHSITRIRGGLNFAVSVTLDQTVSSDTTVALSVPSGSPLGVPATLTVPAGSNVGSAPLTSSSVSSNTAVTVTASLNGTAVTPTITVTP